MSEHIEEQTCPKCGSFMDMEGQHEPELLDDDLVLDHIPDVKESREIRKRFDKQRFWPNTWHVNERGNTDLLRVGYNGAVIMESWV